jgi:phosphatidate phosphatase APP1
MIKSLLRSLTEHVEYHFDQLKTRLEARLDPLNRKILIIPYFGYATENEVHIRARVLFDNGLSPATDADKLWKNLLNTYRRINSDEIPSAVVQVKVNGQTAEITADEEGFLTVDLALEKPLDAKLLLHDIQFKLLRLPPSPKLPSVFPEVTATGQVILPPRTAQFGIISDLDDTVIQTDVLHLISMARNTFLQNSRTRLPFSGVAGFYRALQNGTSKTYNPIYYVSSSPWNLYDLLLDFFTVREIPVGTMFLRNFGFPEVYSEGHKSHKLAVIEQLLNTYPHLPFILIGDSSQLDPEIYTQVAERYPQRIRVIYIRDVTPLSTRDEQVKELAQRLKGLGVNLLLVKDTVAAAEDALQRQLILPEAMPDIREERATDNRPPDKVDEVVATAIDEAAEIVEEGVTTLRGSSGTEDQSDSSKV